MSYQRQHLFLFANINTQRNLKTRECAVSKLSTALIDQIDADGNIKRKRLQVVVSVYDQLVMVLPYLSTSTYCFTVNELPKHDRISEGHQRMRPTDVYRLMGKRGKGKTTG